MVALAHLAERALRRMAPVWRLLDRSGPPPAARPHGLADHVVLVGYGRVGAHIAAVLERLHAPLLIVEHDGLGRARALVVVAVVRDRQVLPNPKSSTLLAAGDQLGLILAEVLVSGGESDSTAAIHLPRGAREVNGHKQKVSLLASPSGATIVERSQLPFERGAWYAKAEAP